MKTLGCRVEDETFHKFQRWCVDREVTASEALREFVANVLGEEGGDGSETPKTPKGMTPEEFAVCLKSALWECKDEILEILKTK